ncbi:MAG: hypothetical protein E7679_02490 [Ruminococcaceae bacterium]|nr:hypothetical protein [Oscillospiraceae bacterium]
MKKFLAVCLVLACLFSFVACKDKNEEQELDTTNPYFTGKVIELGEGRCLIEVTHTGSGCFFVGEQLFVNTSISDCPEYKLGDHLRVSFDGKVALSYPAQVLGVFSILKADSEGNPI